MTWSDRQPWWLEVSFLALVIGVTTAGFWIADGSADLLGTALIFCGAVSGLTLRRRRLSQAPK